ncbi:citrate synthase [Virgibacillus salexigens]|uniref:citrate synthase n=1 Tax=Virgibacillus salexigens TaxID=61016 RepID=UPI00190D3CE0|nr:citrate synthase [Virgibacillus salexigens]
MSTKEQYVPGLDGVIASETAISFLDTEQEKIIIRGHELIDLSKQNDYIDIVHLLLDKKLPNQEEKADLEKKLTSNYHIPSNIMDLLALLPENTHPMDGLRTGLSALSGYDEDIDNRSLEANKSRAYALLGKLPAITVNSYRLIQGQKAVQPNQDLAYSANFLYMITGKKPENVEAEIFDRSLLLYSEHEMPNSTFTARVIASTNSDMYGALTGGVASLKGNLHGGANEAVMYMLNEAKSEAEFEELLHKKLVKKEKIMGFGHRVYMKKMDPRALVMKESLKQLCDEKGDHLLLEMCEAGEKIMKEEKGLYPNLDYYAAPVYWMLGIPIGLYTPIFFSARTAGLAAHVIEQHEHNRLFRPRVNYVGKSY